MTRRLLLPAMLILMLALPSLGQNQPSTPAAAPPVSPGNGGALVPLLSENHILRAGDEIVFHISSLPEMENLYVVRVDGFFFHPLVGEVKASGRTLGDLRADLKQRLAKELKKPEFKLGLRQVARHQVAVLGEANQQGTFDVGLGSTVLDVIAQAGGLTEKADKDTAMILRGSERMEVSLEASEGGGLTEVRSGDVLYILPGSPVSVTGEVIRPGIYAVSRLKGDPRQALLAAGGAKEEASLSRVRLIRATLPEPMILDLSANPATPLPEEAQSLKEGDILVVPARQAIVLGAVSQPGPVPLRGNETLIDILPPRIAASSKIEKVIVVRAADVAANREKTEEYNLKEYFEEGKAEAAVPIHDGDLVYVPGKQEGGFGSGLRSILSLIGIARIFF